MSILSYINPFISCNNTFCLEVTSHDQKNISTNLKTALEKRLENSGGAFTVIFNTKNNISLSCFDEKTLKIVENFCREQKVVCKVTYDTIYKILIEVPKEKIKNVLERSAENLRRSTGYYVRSTGKSIGVLIPKEISDKYDIENFASTKLVQGSVAYLEIGDEKIPFNKICDRVYIDEENKVIIVLKISISEKIARESRKDKKQKNPFAYIVFNDEKISSIKLEYEDVLLSIGDTNSVVVEKEFSGSSDAIDFCRKLEQNIDLYRIKKIYRVNNSRNTPAIRALLYILYLLLFLLYLMIKKRQDDCIIDNQLIIRIFSIGCAAYLAYTVNYSIYNHIVFISCILLDLFLSLLIKQTLFYKAILTSVIFVATTILPTSYVDLSIFAKLSCMFYTYEIAILSVLKYMFSTIIDEEKAIEEKYILD